MELTELIQIIGMVLDGVGAYLLMRGFKKLNPETIQEMSQMSFGINRNFRTMLLEQKADGYYGGMLLLIGFTCMLLATVSKSLNILTNQISPLLCAATFLCVIMVLIIFIRYFIPNRVKKFKQQATKNAHSINQ